MSNYSPIEWTDATWNPVTGCTKVSQGCKHCYAEVFAERWRGVKGHHFEQGFDLRLWPERLNLPLGWKKPKTIFVNSMSDLFHEAVPLKFIQDVFTTMVACPHHRFQVLTKRAERLAELEEFLPWTPNIWMGVSVEDQRVVDRIALLQTVQAHIRFLSCEPLLGPLEDLDLNGIHWVIVGGESGPGARPMTKEWVLSIREQCKAADIPFFFKQWGGVQKARWGRNLEGRTYDSMPTAHSV